MPERHRGGRRKSNRYTEQRAKSRSFIWARVEADGGGVESVLTTIEGYDFTKMASVRIVERVLAPRGIFGIDLVME